MSEMLENTTNITVNANEKIIVLTPTYFANLTDIISSANERYTVRLLYRFLNQLPLLSINALCALCTGTHQRKNLFLSD